MLASLRQMLVESGVLATSLYAFDRALRLLRCGAVHFYRLQAQPVPAQPLLPPHRGRQISVQRLRLGEPCLAQLPRPPAVIEARFAQGSVGFGAFRGDELVGTLWLHRGCYREDEVRCDFLLPEQLAWDFDVYVRPDLRGSFVFARLWDVAFAYLRECAVTHTVSRVAAVNAASLHAHDRLGARTIGSATFVALGSWQWMLTTRRPFVHFSAGQDRVCLPLDLE